MQYNMAAEVNQNYFTWSQEESSVQDSSQETPQVFDHGSISFGRFELESLAWEKWSVFTNDRRHEEFLKFNGLVAKKKAYFEEYFKRIRELKALQQQNQQTELNLEYSGDGSDSSQTGEDEPVADQRSPAGSGAHHDDSMEHIVAKTTSEHELESYKGHEYGSLNNEISASNCSPPVGGLQLIDQEISGNTGSDNSDKMDMLQQNANCCQGDLKKSHEIMMAPQRTIGKNSQISQASKIIPKTVKMTSSSSNHTIAYKVPMSGKPSMISQNSEQDKVKLLRRPQAAISVVGTLGRSKLMAEGAPGVISVRRPSSSASQRPSTRERRPVTRDGSRKPSDIDTPCRPCTAEKFPATRKLAPKQACTASSRPSTAERHPFTKDSKHASITTTCRPSTAERRPVIRDGALRHTHIATTACRPSTAERRPVIRDGALRHTHIATPCRPSTVERHPVIRDVVPKHGDIVNPCQLPVTRGTAQKHADVVTLRRPSTAEKRPVTRETKQKYADVFTLRRPSTAERRSVSREIAPKHANVPPSCRPSTAERRPATRDTVLKHANVASPCWSSTPDRCLRRESVQQHSDISTTPHRPTGERHPITKESTLKLDPATPFRLRGMLSHSKGAMATTATPSKTMNPNLVKNCKPEIKRHVNERMEHPLGIQKSSSVNFPPKKMLSSNVRANGVQENIRKPNKEDILDTVRSRVSASKNITPLQTGRRTPNPPPPPPPLHRSSQIASKPNPNNFSVGARKPKASAPRWH